MAGRKLKVFQAQFGFFDTVVAAPSQVAALRAWDAHQNLFANGAARLATDEAAKAAALDQPGTVLRRAVGSAEPFALEPASLPAAPAARTKTSVESPPKLKPSAPRPTGADRSDLDAAEKALRVIDANRAREEAAFRDRRAELDAARETAQIRYVRDRAAAEARMKAARAAYGKAGGRT
jgi:hypothetical protein